MTLKIAVVAAMPSAIASVTEIVTTGALRLTRQAYRRSVNKFWSMDILSARPAEAADVTNDESRDETRCRRSGEADRQAWVQYHRRAAATPSRAASCSNSSDRSAARNDASPAAGNRRT